MQDELQFSVYNFECADVEKAWKHLELYEAECQALLDEYRALGRLRLRRILAKSEQRTAKSGPLANSE